MKPKAFNLQKCHFHIVEPNNLCFPDTVTEMVQKNPTQKIASLLKRKLFFIAIHILDVVRAMGARPKLKKATSGWSRRDQFFCGLVIN